MAADKLEKELKNKIFISKRNFLIAVDNVIGGGYKVERKQAMLDAVLKHAEVSW